MKPETKARAEEMAAMYQQGFTLQTIGDFYGVTRERARQLVASCGLDRSDGGAHINALAKRSALQTAMKNRKDARRHSVFGCSQSEFIFWNNGCPFGFGAAAKGSPAEAFTQQRYNANFAGHVWQLTFPQWAKLWKDSGKWEHRGLSQDSYVMGRIDRSKPFEVGNVEVVTLRENSAKSVEWLHPEAA